MRNKGFFWFFTILLLVVSLYQISFSFIGSGIEKEADQLAIEKVEELKANTVEGDSAKLPNGTYVNFDTDREAYDLAKAAFINELLKEKNDEVVFLGNTYNEVKDKSVSLGLDLEGGMSVTLELSMSDLVKNAALNPRDLHFLKPYESALEEYNSLGGDFIDLFVAKHQEMFPERLLIREDDYSRLSEFDALFIRETASVNHHTYRMSRRAQREGLAVIDSPESILRCANKVYLAELLSLNRIPTPRTIIIHSENHKGVEKKLGFPCVLKLPDSSFSQGVVKVNTPEEMRLKVKEMVKVSDLIIAQEFLPTSYDWRVGVLNNEVLFVCKYYMAKDHWQIYNWGSRKKNDVSGTFREGEEARLSDAAFLRLWHYPGKRATAGELWQHLLERVADRLSAEQVTTLRYQLYHGTLSQRILSQLKGDFRRPALHEVYRRLGDCLQSNTLL